MCGFPSSVLKESAGNAGHTGSISWLGKSPGEGNSNPLQYSRLGNPSDREPGGAESTGLQKSDMT